MVEDGSANDAAARAAMVHWAVGADGGGTRSRITRTPEQLEVRVADARLVRADRGTGRGSSGRGGRGAWHRSDAADRLHRRLWQRSPQPGASRPTPTPPIKRDFVHRCRPPLETCSRRVLTKTTTLRTSRRALPQHELRPRALHGQRKRGRRGRRLREHILRLAPRGVGEIVGERVGRHVGMSHQDATESAPPCDSYFTSAADSPVAASRAPQAASGGPETPLRRSRITGGDARAAAAPTRPTDPRVLWRCV